MHMKFAIKTKFLKIRNLYMRDLQGGNKMLDTDNKRTI